VSLSKKGRKERRNGMVLPYEISTSRSIRKIRGERKKLFNTTTT